MSHENDLGTNDRAPNAMSFDHASYNLHPIILCRIIRNDIRTRWTLVGEYTLSSFVLEMHETCNTFELWGGVLGGVGWGRNRQAGASIVTIRNLGSWRSQAPQGGENEACL